MKALLLGATGGTGREIVKRATAKGHSVVAVARSIAKAGDLAGATLVQGDARDEALLARALEGFTGVISSIGTSVSPFLLGRPPRSYRDFARETVSGWQA